MNLFDVLLKLIQTLSLVGGDKYRQLTVDVTEWENTCVEDSEDKIKSMYAKIHKGVWLRLLTPFLYFYLLSWVRDLSNPDNGGDFLDD